MIKPHYCRKCPTKPKAHYWVFEPQGPNNTNRAKCKYCGKERQFTHKGPYDLVTAHEIHAKQLGGYPRPTVGRKVS